MIDTDVLKNKKYIVCGMARSGIAAAELLVSHGAKVTLQDIKPMDALIKLHDIEAYKKKGIDIYAGSNPDDIAEEFDTIVLSPGVPYDLPFVQKALAKGIEVISEIELAYSLTPCPVCAVTGTNGKTTTTTLTGLLLETKYNNTAVVGNIGVAYSQKVKGLRENDYVCAEISSFQLEGTKTFRPHISAVLNITPDHLNRHKTMENYVAVKEMIFANQTSEDFTILNNNDEYCVKMADKTRGRVFFFSSTKRLEEGIFLDGEHIHIVWNGIDEMLIDTNELRILGVHNYENVMAAAACAVCAGVTLEDIRQVLLGFNGVEHRIEYCGTFDSVDCYNDSKGTNPDAAIRAVLAMKKPIVLIGGGYDKDSEYDDWVKLFKGRVKKLILIGVTAPKIAACCDKYGFSDYDFAEDFKECVAKCKAAADLGDCILLSPACASWGMFEDYEQRGRVFKELVKG
ncbi:MAG: UDP-N-acetylmuramoyl-L-alanine--D-glutamate ligase [Candidatus Metalachnospira sp.]|nr:UDP-N-acetylmuramoyl-L-alanine--D-glutamate ligase [Candidatus Metalachnospira sp.]